MKKSLMALMVLGIVVLGSQAYALNIDPSYTPVWTGSDPSQSAIDATIASILGSATELYKATPGMPVVENGDFSGSYETQFIGSADNWSGATITYTGGAFVDDPQYLLVKDGKNEPAWYLFDLTPNWDGKETLNLSGFWTGNGSISHVTLYGTEGTTVPEPGSLMLLGLGLIGVGAVARRKIKK